MSEDIHTRAQQTLGVLEIEDVRGNPDAVLVRLVDGRPIQFRSELFKLPVAVIDPERCFGAVACSICQAACPVEDCIIEEPDAYGRMVCAVVVDKCIGCGLCVTLGNTTAPQPRDFGCPPDYDAIDMADFTDVVEALEVESNAADASEATP